jgi:hypothetical protein
MKDAGGVAGIGGVSNGGVKPGIGNQRRDGISVSSKVAWRRLWRKRWRNGEKRRCRWRKMAKSRKAVEKAIGEPWLAWRQWRKYGAQAAGGVSSA